MSWRASVRATPALLRAGVAEAVAYRAEMLIWVLATTMPLVMLALWSSAAEGAPIGRYGERQFVAYFLATFIVRQLTGSWVFWDINFEIRNGTLGMRLLRPVHPLYAYAAEAIASLPMRLVVSIPVAAVALAVLGRAELTVDPLVWLLWLASMIGAWLITLFVNFVVGSAAFFLESSAKLMDAWGVFFFVLSGYLVPVDLLPHQLASVVDWLPFRYQIGLPVELMTHAHDRAEALALLAGQWVWVALGFTASALAWRRGIRRFASYGG